MKKITAVLLALLLVVAIFTACKKKDTVTDDAPTGSQTEQSTMAPKKDETTRRTDNGTGGPGSEKPGENPGKDSGEDPGDDPADSGERDYTKDYDIPGAGAMISVFPGIRRTLE